MSLTRYLPLPSDRMGIIWNLLSVKESIILEYGPAGTTHFSMSLYGELGVDNENRLFTTHMSEEDVVMGDVTRLEKALVELDEAYHPKVIFVVASSIAAVIGTDIKGVCNYMQERVHARLAAFDQGGFRGDYSMGCQAVWKLLAEEFPLPDQKPEPDSYNVLGVSVGSYRAKSDLWEIEELLKETFGMHPIAVYCCDTSISQLERSGRASVNLVLRDEALPCARTLEKKCGTPYFKGMPYGYQGTLQWLTDLGKAIGREPNPAVIQRLKAKIADASMYRMYTMMLKADRPRSVLVGEYETVKGLGAFLDSIGIPAQKKLCLHSLRPVEDPAQDIVHMEAEKERIDYLGSLSKVLVLGDDASLRMCPQGNTRFRIAMPMLNGVQIATHLPVAGERGADHLMETVEYYFQNLH